MAEFEKGDIVSVHFPFTDGSDLKRRPALVLSNATLNRQGDLLLMQITSKPNQDEFSLPLANENLNPPLPIPSFLRLHKIFTLDKKLVIHKISHLERSAYNQVIEELFKLLR